MDNNNQLGFFSQGFLPGSATAVSAFSDLGLTLFTTVKHKQFLFSIVATASTLGWPKLLNSYFPSQVKDISFGV